MCSDPFLHITEGLLDYQSCEKETFPRALDRHMESIFFIVYTTTLVRQSVRGRMIISDAIHLKLIFERLFTQVIYHHQSVLTIFFINCFKLKTISK